MQKIHGKVVRKKLKDTVPATKTNSYTDDEELLNDNEENINEEDEFLFEYTFDYTEEERDEFWRISNSPSMSRRSMIFSVVCIGLGLILLLLRHSATLLVAFAGVGVVWTGVPFLIYYIRYARYKKAARGLWKHKWQISIYDGHIEMKRNDLDDPFIYEYDEIYKMINMGNKLYLYPSRKDIIILDKRHVPNVIIDALLSLDTFIQEGEKE